jgi:hypothetical protein
MTSGLLSSVIVFNCFLKLTNEETFQKAKVAKMSEAEKTLKRKESTVGTSSNESKCNNRAEDKTRPKKHGKNNCCSSLRQL